MYILLSILLVIVFIIIATIKFKLHPVFSLVIAALISGGLFGINVDELLDTISSGFGKTLSSIGLIIAFGTVIGIFLEKTNATKVLANTILNLVGLKHSALAINITGFVISIPVFCDSGFIIMSSLNKALSKKTGISIVVFAIALATGLYAAHVFVPPTPGPLAAAAVIGADLGLVMLLGLLVAIPVAFVGFLWASYIGKKISIDDIGEIQSINEEVVPEENITIKKRKVFAPILVPILLIALKSIMDYPSLMNNNGIINSIISFAGNPIIALLIGVILAFFIDNNISLKTRYEWIVIALKEAGIIVLITGAGGAFGAVLKVVDIANVMGIESNFIGSGIFIAFIIAAVLKTAQGSSTVSIITTAAIMAPLLMSLGLDSSISKACVVLAIGAGAMTVSHVNDSYFWVVSQFSGMNVKTALKSHTAATLLQGVTGLILVFLIQYFLG